MDAVPTPPPTPGPPRWHIVALAVALCVVGWWVWRAYGKTMPDVAIASNPNATMPSLPPKGIPDGLVESMARSVDNQIPVVMTSGADIPFDHDEIVQIVRTALSRVNVLNQALSLIKIQNVSKTQDSYKTVAYDIVCSVHDSKSNVSILVFMSVLIPVSGHMYIRSMRLFNDNGTEPELHSASSPSGPAPFLSAVDVLASMSLPAK